MIQTHLLNFNSTQIHLAYFDELEEDKMIKSLTLQECERLQSYTSAHRRKEFLVTRWLYQQAIGGPSISYTETGAPQVENANISISHTRGAVGIAYNADFRVGIDLEYPSSRILKLAHKFISEREADLIELTDYNTLTQIWCAKETLYKLAGIPGLDFKKQLEVNFHNSTTLLGKIYHQGKTMSTSLTCSLHDGLILVTNTEPLVG